MTKKELILIGSLAAMITLSACAPSPKGAKTTKEGSTSTTVAAEAAEEVSPQVAASTDYALLNDIRKVFGLGFSAPKTTIFMWEGKEEQEERVRGWQIEAYGSLSNLSTQGKSIGKYLRSRGFEYNPHNTTDKIDGFSREGKNRNLAAMVWIKSSGGAYRMNVLCGFVKKPQFEMTY